MTDTQLIALVIRRYFPQWDPPEDNGYTWIKTLCPFHGEDNPSAAVSYELQAFKCMACHVSGDVIKLIREQEDVGYLAAKSIAEGLSVGSNIPVQTKPARKPGRRVFGQQGDSRADTVRSGIRNRPSAWS